jgi:tRNA nucleotidyltransferase/poly(A) polymerase
MKKFLQHPIFKTVGSCGNDMEQPVYVVGGYVRDSLLGRSSKDVDFVTVGPGIPLAKCVNRELKERTHLSVFKNFGTAQIKSDDWEFEFVGARKESYTRGSRKPIVEDGSLEDDQLRRDFTINAMSISLNSDSFGELLDPFNGQSDLKDGIIRTPRDPVVTFDDDPLRMLRAARFASQLNFEIESETFQAMKDRAPRLSIVSMERIIDEVNKIMMSPKPSVGFKILFDTGLLQQFFPEFCDLQGVETVNGISHKDNFYHTLEVLDNVAERSDHLWLRWAAVMHDIAKPRTKRFDQKEGWTFHGHEDKGARMTKGIFRRLKLPMDHRMKYVQKLVLLHLRPIPLVKESVTDSAIRRLLFDAGDDLDDLLLLCRCDITSKNERKVKRFLKNLDVVEQKIQDVEERDRVRNWQPPVSGEDIMNLFKIGPGREIGIIKNALKEAILDGKIANSKQEALNFVVEKGRELGLKKGGS